MITMDLKTYCVVYIDPSALPQQELIEAYSPADLERILNERNIYDVIDYYEL